MALTVKKPFDWAHRGVQVEHFEAGRDISDQTEDLTSVAIAEGWAEEDGKKAAKTAPEKAASTKASETK